MDERVAEDMEEQVAVVGFNLKMTGGPNVITAKQTERELSYSIDLRQRMFYLDKAPQNSRRTRFP